MSLWDEIVNGFLLLLRDNEIWSITSLSIFISLSAVALSTVIGIPLGIQLATSEVRGNKLISILINTGMGMPPVLLGLVLYLLFARTGPLGSIRILFTPIAMILAQFLLTLPIVIGVTRSRFMEIPDSLPETLLSLGCDEWQLRLYEIYEVRGGIFTAIILAFGRAISEVGAIIIVGGNIRFHTRVLTTAIITEVSRGKNEIAIAFGIIILVISLIINSMLTSVQFKEN